MSREAISSQHSAVSAPSIVGQCVEAGDDNEGNARMTIVVLRAHLTQFPSNLLFKRVKVTLEEQP